VDVARVALPGEARRANPRQNDTLPTTATAWPGTPMEFTSKRYDFSNKDSDYASLAEELSGLLAGEPDLIANAANTSALLFDALPDINWVGFYFLRPTASASAGSTNSGELVVGPFQGKPACVRIPLGKGVCGTAAASRKTIVVRDVHEFPGHIACDAASQSEIVVPLIKAERLLGVLDIDSPSLGRFDDADRRGIERLASIFVQASEGFS
jgi:L-methionine (R)-S-oxide reductase